MRVPPGVHRAPLGGGDVAVLVEAGGTWQWMNTATERIWSAALAGSVPDLVERMRADGVPGDVDTVVARTVQDLEQAGLLTTSQGEPGTLPAQMPDVTAVAAPCAGPGWSVRVLAWMGLLLALAMMRLPMRARMRLLGVLRVLPAAPADVAASASAAVLQIRPGWWPGRIACMEVSLATVLTIALRGRRAHWILGSRRMPSEAHAWVWTPAGALGLSGRDISDPRRPWVGVASAPPVHPNERTSLVRN